MRIPRLYHPGPLHSGQETELDAAAAHYLGRVLRLTPGRSLILFNGEGGEYRASVIELGKKRARVLVESFDPLERESALDLHLGIAISRGERMDWILQKATELGVSAVTPLFSERTEVRLAGERLAKKRQHWQQILVSACEQCQRNRLPTLHPAQALDTWLPGVQADCRLVLHHRTEASLEHPVRPDSVALLIGPEGGLSETEISQAEGAGFQPLALGPRVLRTETAPLAAISVLQYLWGDLG